ncbi:MAG: class I SAM-dependent methyltransferase [Chthoniobacterales bacterium]|nr:class I SAM-dependent methyltransferase [Chthoniobacterales bacterium]
MSRPHSSLSKHYQDPAEKQTFLRKIFDDAAPHYESIARLGFFGSGQWYRKDALRRAGLTPGMRVLDVASGTGPTARAIREIVGDEKLITCLEPSAGMMAESKKTLGCEHIQATAEAIPVADETYDFLTMGFALRHVDDLERAFAEYRRVLKPGGKALLLELTLPKNGAARFFLRLYLKHTLPLVIRVLTRSQQAAHMMWYYWDTMETVVPPETVMHALTQAGFTNVQRRVSIGLFNEYEALRDGDRSHSPQA